MTISILNYQHKYSISLSKIEGVAGVCAKKLKLVFKEISIIFVGEQKMRALNKRFLGHDYVTDVITFKHGEIVICPSLAYKNAKAYGNAYQKELMLYVVHGLLHLAGYDDHAPEDVKTMRLMEAKLLSL